MPFESLHSEEENSGQPMFVAEVKQSLEVFLALFDQLNWRVPRQCMELALDYFPEITAEAPPANNKCEQ